MSTPKTAEGNSRRELLFSTLAGVEGAKLEAGPPVQTLDHGVEVARRPVAYVVGRWKENLTELRLDKPARLAEAFANWRREDADVLQFTKKYGALHEAPEPRKEFRFPLFAWRGDQDYFRDLWESLIKRREVNKGRGLTRNIQHRLIFRDGKLRYETSQLLVLLQLDLLTCPRERLRKCLRPNCPNPYFVAHHRGQRYCSDLCAAWAQRRWKREWWNEKGKGWLKGRKRKVKRRQR